MSVEPARECYAETKAREAEERGDHVDAALWRRVKVNVDLAPDFTPAQRDQLRILLRPTPAAVPDVA